MKTFVIYCFDGSSHYLERLRSGASRRHSPLSHCHWPSNPWTCHYCYRGNPSAGYSANDTSTDWLWPLSCPNQWVCSLLSLDKNIFKSYFLCVFMFFIRLIFKRYLLYPAQFSHIWCWLNLVKKILLASKNPQLLIYLTRQKTSNVVCSELKDFLHEQITHINNHKLRKTKDISL